ncbi:hypothetical protein K443DRAFT_284457 [Laccaria amethystina LaAM-08-1]|uniref:Uncharacterized protein n=1 Tax=Laccaria amethystina LaAM-08-1 TaxID=1095629 RepID=A0A0C9XFI6_9AGAR|nr:hypothetical protein K443DRAFT_284457 [Laccaria amethystina LaAM-08-1]
MDAASRRQDEFSVRIASGLRPDFQDIYPFWDPTFEPNVRGPPCHSQRRSPLTLVDLSSHLSQSACGVAQMY